MPVSIVLDSPHKLIRHSDRVIAVLKENRSVSLTGKGTVVPAFDKGPGLSLLGHLATNEVFDVRMVGIEDDHLGRTTGRPATLDDPCKSVESLHKGDGSAGSATSGERLSCRANRRQVRSCSTAVLEEHPFGLSKRKDRLHRVLNRVDEAVVDNDVVAQVVPALCLDIVNVHDAASLDCYDAR